MLRSAIAMATVVLTAGLAPAGVVTKVIDYTETNSAAPKAGKVGLRSKDAEGVARFDDFAISPE